MRDPMFHSVRSIPKQIKVNNISDIRFLCDQKAFLLCKKYNESIIREEEMSKRTPDLIIGIILIVSSLISILSKTYVFSAGLFNHGRVNISALLILLMMFVIVIYVFHPHKWLLYLNGIFFASLIIYILMNIRVVLWGMSALRAILTFASLAFGIGLVGRTLLTK